VIYVEQAIKKAIEGGYQYRVDFGSYDYPDKHFELPKKTVIEVFLDPDFWRALGKAEGWKKKVCSRCGIIPTYAVKNKSSICYSCCIEPRIDIDEQIYHWHRFIDHLAEGKEAEEFFKELLKK